MGLFDSIGDAADNVTDAVGDTASNVADAATMGGPMMASLDSTTSPHDVHQFASGGLGGEDEEGWL